MNELLSPKLAADAANIAYEFQPLSGFQDKVEFDELTRQPFYKSGFDNDGRVTGDVLSATSGNRSMAIGSTVASMMAFGTPLPGRYAAASILHKRTGFAIAVRGNDNGGFKNHLMISVRGTSGTADILTDLNASLSGRFGTGRVHGGFNDVFDTLIADLDSRSDLFSGIEVVHIVGHSLGGALAILLLATLLQRNYNNLYCYTFGAPRVGNHAFGEWLSSKIGKDRVKRVYHPGDPVPMAPVYPFFQAPFDSGIKLAVPQGTLVAPGHHSMVDSYSPRVSQYKDWPHLEGSQQVKPDWRREIEAWLSGDRGLNDVGISSELLLSKIRMGIVYIIERMVIVGLSTVFTIGATILDHLAEALYYFANKAIEFAGWVTKLIYSILRFLGLTIIKGISLTVTFIRYVLERLKAAMSGMWRQALDIVYN